LIKIEAYTKPNNV